MIVILIKDLKGTGKAGDVVKVSDGYARNKLIPAGIAKEATEGNVRSLEKQKAVQAKKAAEEKAAAIELSNRIESLETVIKTKSGEGGRLFGSITAKDITDAVKEQHNISLDKKKLVMDGPIKNVGEFCIEAKIYTEVTAKIKVIVETK